jgi:hypothetical protein
MGKNTRQFVDYGFAATPQRKGSFLGIVSCIFGVGSVVLGAICVEYRWFGSPWPYVLRAIIGAIAICTATTAIAGRRSGMVVNVIGLALGAFGFLTAIPLPWEN